MLVSESGNGGWLKRYFARYENDKVFVWTGGATSFSSDGDVMAWKHAKLYEE